ncbi:MAG: hypothetical protein Q7R73_03295 [bacterium]|nr:hypothetical protein [bacterium]
MSQETTAIACQNTKERLLARIDEMKTRAIEQKQSSVKKDSVIEHQRMLQRFGEHYFSFSERELRGLNSEELCAFDAVVAERVRRPIRRFWIFEAVTIGISGALGVFLHPVTFFGFFIPFAAWATVWLDSLGTHRRFLRTQAAWSEEQEARLPKSE